MIQKFRELFRNTKKCFKNLKNDSKITKKLQKFILKNSIFILEHPFKNFRTKKAVNFIFKKFL